MPARQAKQDDENDSPPMEGIFLGVATLSELPKLASDHWAQITFHCMTS
jgi:hypothetical protein